MNHQIKNEKQPRQFTANDKSGTPVIIEAFTTTLFSQEFAEIMKSAWEIARPAYTPVEMQFLNAFPDVIQNDPHFKPFESLFKNGIEHVDWNVAEEKMQEILKTHFIFDASTWPEEITKKFAHDICFVITIKDQNTQKLIGFITFLVRPGYAPGEVKVMSFALEPAHQNRGLGKILMSMIFKISPDIRRIFLCTRVTNNNALRAYRNWGFIDDKNPVLDHAFNLNHWTFLEYKTEQSNILQTTAGVIK